MDIHMLYINTMGSGGGSQTDVVMGDGQGQSADLTGLIQKPLNSLEKPPYSYIRLITIAILQSPQKKLTVRGICDFISNHFPYYRETFPAWQNSIRNSLYVNDCFEKIPREPINTGKEHYWTFHRQSEDRSGDVNVLGKRKRKAEHDEKLRTTVGPPEDRFMKDVAVLPDRHSPLSLLSPPETLPSAASDSGDEGATGTAKEQSTDSAGPIQNPKSRVVKPPYSYVALITMAILQSPQKELTLSGICQFVSNRYPYYSERFPAWRNSFRNNLYLNDCFVKVPRETGNLSKDNYWAFDSQAVEMFDSGSFLRRRKRFKRDQPDVVDAKTDLGLKTEAGQDESLKDRIMKKYAAMLPDWHSDVRLSSPETLPSAGSDSSDEGATGT